VPQGSVLGPILFLIFINDLDSTLTSSILKFADDTKLFGRVNTDRDREVLQRDLYHLLEWSKKWQMPFNTQIFLYHALNSLRADLSFMWNLGQY